ncbi:hypothetical protein ACFPRL_09010 [Pseudoclavibacter helvolus]
MARKARIPRANWGTPTPYSAIIKCGHHRSRNRARTAGKRPTHER